MLHNPEFPQRLGLEGPDSVNALDLTKIVPINCSGVVSEEEASTLYNFVYLPQVSNFDPKAATHILYMYTPQILQDLAQTMAGAIPNRILNDEGAYTMQLVHHLQSLGIRRGWAPPLTVPVEPTGVEHVMIGEA